MGGSGLKDTHVALLGIYTWVETELSTKIPSNVTRNTRESTFLRVLHPYRCMHVCVCGSHL